MIIRILLLFISFIAYAAHAIPSKITASSEPLANIIRLVAPNESQINIISTAGMCPHEYILRPSDFKNAIDSDFIIYISDNFEPFIKPIAKNSTAKVINLSKILEINPSHDMHIWMSLKNIRKIIEFVSREFNTKSSIAIAQIDALIDYKKTQLSYLHEVVLLSDSLEYLFEDMQDIAVTKLYINSGMASAKDIVFLNSMAKNKCVLINDKYNVEPISSNIGHKIVPIASESWSLDGYTKIIDDIKKHCQAQD